jgi:uroporphyrinogen decarboxylase
MNPYQRFYRRIQGLPVDRPPNFNIMMTFAAHYIHKPLAEYYQDFRVLVDANLAVQSAFALDLVQAISDPFREAADLGAEIIFPPDNLPICPSPLLGDLRKLTQLRPLDSGSGRRMADRLAAVQALRSRVGGEVPIMGWVEGALAEAAVLRGVNSFLIDLSEEPKWLAELLELGVNVAIQFARAQIAAGADIIGLGDAIASQISPEMYRRFALPYEQRIFAAVRELGACPRLHICGNTTHLLPDMLHSGAEIIDLDWMVDLRTAAQIFDTHAVICGNFDPVGILLQGAPATVAAAVRTCLIEGGPRLISAAGCEVPEGTPPENLFAQATALAHYSSIENTTNPLSQ